MSPAFYPPTTNQPNQSVIRHLAQPDETVPGFLDCIDYARVKFEMFLRIGSIITKPSEQHHSHSDTSSPAYNHLTRGFTPEDKSYRAVEMWYICVVLQVPSDHLYKKKPHKKTLSRLILQTHLKDELAWVNTLPVPGSRRSGTRGRTTNLPYRTNERKNA